MTWPLPSPDALFDSAAAQFETAFPEANPRAPNNLMGVISRVQAMAIFELYLYQRGLADELMPDTAVDWLERHADVWGVTRIPAAAAIGRVSFTGADGTVIPTGAEMKTPSGVSVLTTETVSIDFDGGTASAAVQAASAGAAGNMAAATVLTLVSPISGLATQAGTVDAGGLVGGRDAEADGALRARLLAFIRARPKGGSVADYDAWARQVAGVAYVSVKPNWVGLGSVGVIIMMDGGTVPTTPQLDAVAAVIAPVRPVTAEVLVIAGARLVVPVSVQVRPDTAATRAAITTALGVFFAADGAIGGTIFRSRLDEAVSAAAGEYSHTISLPSADVVPAATELPVLGTITWVP